MISYTHNQLDQDSLNLILEFLGKTTKYNKPKVSVKETQRSWTIRISIPKKQIKNLEKFDSLIMRLISLLPK